MGHLLGDDAQSPRDGAGSGSRVNAGDLRMQVAGMAAEPMIARWRLRTQAGTWRARTPRAAAIARRMKIRPIRTIEPSPRDEVWGQSAPANSPHKAERTTSDTQKTLNHGHLLPVSKAMMALYRTGEHNIIITKVKD